MKLRTKLLGGATALVTVLAPIAGLASSHREAPFIAKSPKVDGTDFYIFNSYEAGRAGYVTILANYEPLQDGAGGPNFFAMDPDAVYEIHIDNDGDAKEDLTFQFQFTSTLANGGAGLALDVGPAGNTKSVAVPLTNIGGVTSTSSAAQNVLETYTLNMITGPRRSGTVTPITEDGTNATSFPKPLDNVGAKTFSAQAYATYAQTFVRQLDIPGCTPPAGTHPRVFVGQRREGFSVNLGQIFDLVNFNTTGAGGLANVVGAEDQNLNTLNNKNVTTIALEVPATCLQKAPSTIIGAWTTASVRQARVLNPTPTFTTPSREGGPLVQVSLLGMPPVNEVVIGLPDKDKFNASEPKDDGQFANYVTNPTLPELLEILFGGAGVRAPNNFPRADLVAAFLTGVTGVNANGSTAEYVRFNTAFAATPANKQNNFGAVGCFDAPTASAGAALDTNNADCDPNGFPNGRRPGDDVVDIEIRVAMGALVDTTDAVTGGCIHAGQAGCLPYGDGAGVNALQIGGASASLAYFDTSFPYLRAPNGGSP